MNKYNYFIYYQHTDLDELSYNKNCTIILNKPILHDSDIKNIEKEIENNTSYKNVLVKNFILLYKNVDER